MLENFLTRWINIVGKTGYPECVDPMYKLSWEIDDSRVKTLRTRLLVVCNFVFHLLRSGVRRPWVKPAGIPGFKGFDPIGVYTQLLLLENGVRVQKILETLRRYQLVTYFKTGAMVCAASGKKENQLSVTLNLVPTKLHLSAAVASLKGFLYQDLPPALEDKVKKIGDKQISMLPFPKTKMAESSVRFHVLETKPSVLIARSRSSLVIRFEFAIPVDIADWAPPKVQQKMIRESFIRSWRARK